MTYSTPPRSAALLGLLLGLQWFHVEGSILRGHAHQNKEFGNRGFTSYGGSGFRVLESGSWAKVLRFDGLLKTDVFTLLPSHQTWFMARHGVYSPEIPCFTAWPGAPSMP